MDRKQIFNSLVKIRDDNNELFQLSNDILQIITQYSIGGQIIGCSVSNCYNKICFDNIKQIRKKMDSDGNKISYYYIHRGGTYCNAVKLKSLYGKYRIFCKKCSQNVKKCELGDSNYDVERQYDGVIYTCFDHSICVYCHRINKKSGRRTRLCRYCHGTLIHRSPLV